ncbi:MAG: glycoside hydrolase family 31 protein [Candidatus Alcyoniella australis]|nr:glycoside hydrolase family 31 protein [Candidatus Alcyoniella australis]
MDYRTHALLAVLAACLLLIAGCQGDGSTEGADGPNLAAASCSWSWALEDDGALSISCGEREMLRLLGAERHRFAPDVSMLFGLFDHRKAGETSVELTLAQGDDEIVLLDGETQAGALNFEWTAQGDLRVIVELAQDYVGSSIKLLCEAEPDDMFWGFGEQYNFIDFRGRSVPIWVSEQGLGRDEDPLLPFTGDLTDSYFPMPYFIDPAAGLGFLLENSEYSYFDLGQSDPTQWSVEVWNGERASFLLLPGPQPIDVVAQLTAEVGRPSQTPPDWAFSGVLLAAQGGEDNVRRRAQTAIDAKVPLSAMWVQDWVGIRHFGLGNYGVKYHWTQDQELYPELNLLISDLRDHDIRFLGYFNPFVVPAYEHYQEMAELNYLIRRNTGRPYKFLISVFSGSLLDVSNPLAIEYFQGYAQAAAQMGQAGWMCDFGEWLPYDAQLAGGFAPSYHNQYATQWHRINREVLQAAYPEGDWLMLTRSGYTYEHQVAQVVWAGDQEADWNEKDGLPTVVRAGLSLGLSGVPFFTHDIGGFSGGPRTKELFLRWTELGAFTPVMRTHDGLLKEENHSFDSDAQTLQHFSRMARIHGALLPYFMQLADEAVQRGLPMLRHTCLVDPDWSGSYIAHEQWMIGNDLLFAPVVRKGEDWVQVLFPQGQWEHLLTGERFEGRTSAVVDAPLGAPAAFVRVGEPLELRRLVQEALDD